VQDVELTLKILEANMDDAVEFISLAECKALEDCSTEYMYKAINEMLSRVFHRAVESAIRSMPELIVRLTEQTTTLNRMTEKFFADNLKFKAYPELVNSTVAELESDNPGDDYTTILAKATKQIQNKIATIEAGQQQTLNFGE